MLECVVNVSEGRDEVVLGTLAGAAGSALLDIHSDPHHHRSVFTLTSNADGIVAAAQSLTREAVRRIDISRHIGVHPRVGAVDVVPFVPLGTATMADALRARDVFAQWAADELGVCCFLYGPERTLPEIRREAWTTLSPDVVPAGSTPHPHPTAGAICVGARDLLIAYNVWLGPEATLADARRAATAVRSSAVRALGLQVGERVQLSLNLVSPDDVGPAQAYDSVRAQVAVAGAELVGLLPDRVLRAIDPQRWDELDLSAARTIEWCVAGRTPTG